MVKLWQALFKAKAVELGDKDTQQADLRPVAIE